MEIINTSGAPAAIGPYSQAVKVSNWLYCSGQIGLDPASGELAPDMAGQTSRAFANLSAVLGAAGLTPADVVKVTLYLVNMNDFAAVNELYAQFFGSHKPARATVAVAALPKGALVEIDAIAFCEDW
jgi:2-iminobutanoate/2-iminopropanoate deaminase